jgi:nicotinamide riboside transporter PnuC
MLSPLQYFAVLLTVCAYAFVRGRGDERTIAAICVVASIASVTVMSPLGSRYSHVEAGVFIVDLATFIGFTLVALRSERFWPLWVAGLQLTTLMAHAFKLGRIDLLPQAYAAAARFWVYPIFIIIVIGTWRSSRRRSAERQKALAA